MPACASLTSISLKTVSTGARQAIEAHAIQPLLTPIIPIALVGLACCAPLQLYLLNSSLGSAPSTYAVPCYQARPFFERGQQHDTEPRYVPMMLAGLSLALPCLYLALPCLALSPRRPVLSVAPHPRQRVGGRRLLSGDST